jgi:hypothetical protein
MKILFVNTWMHPKNMHAMLKYKSVFIELINNISDIDNYDLSTFDCVYSPSDPIDVSKYPGVFFVFGPHFSTFPNEKILNIQSENTMYIMPSQWCIDDWKKNSLCKNLNMVACPFGVDTDKFIDTIPIQHRKLVFIYYKSRHPHELEFIQNLLTHNNINYRIFHYHQRYNEDEYLEYLKYSKFGIWVDGHESQGFALEEALSCNVPLLVWNVRSMNQEYGQNHPDIPATTIPYWDERCGELFYDMNDFKEKVYKFFNNLETYRPREYILENLSIPICEKKFLNILSK